MDIQKIAWMKPSGHGPSGEHKIEEETDGVLTLFCGRSYDREELEEIDVEEANGECRLCVRGLRRRLLGDADLGLDVLVEHGAMTAKAAEILGEVEEIRHTEIEGSGKWGRIITEDAREAVKAKEAT